MRRTASFLNSEESCGGGGYLADEGGRRASACSETKAWKTIRRGRDMACKRS